MLHVRSGRVMDTEAPLPKLPQRSFAILFAVSVVVAIGNTGLISVLPAIGRSIGISDAMASGVFSLSALLWGLTSPYWARVSDRRGRKPLMLIGMAGVMVSMLLCGLVVSAGLRGWGAPVVIFGLFLVARAIFGAFGSASNPATQAYMAERTSRADRTRSMSALAGAFGLGTVVGPFVAPLFVVPVLGLAGPLFAFALLAAIMLFIVYRYLPESGPPQALRAPEADGAARGPALWRDRRVLPFLIYGFLVATCQTAQQQTLGFLIIDQSGMTPTGAQGLIAVAMMFGAVAGLLAQWGVIRMFDMGPRALMRWGVGVAAAGTLLIALSGGFALPVAGLQLSGGYSLTVAGYAIASLGFGLARPGFTAGASLSVNMAEQARAAGAIASVNGLNVILAPAFVYAYEHYGPAPFILTTSILLGLLAYAFFQPTLKSVSAEPAAEESSAAAGLEKMREEI